MKTQTTITEITKDDLVNLFSTALTGSTYLIADYEEAVEHNEDACHEEIIADILLNGGKVLVTDTYADGCHYGDLRWEYNEDYDVTYRVGYIDIMKGLGRAANGTFNTRLSDMGAEYAGQNREFAQRSFHAFAHDGAEWDLTTADCLMQIILFNEIIYG